MPNVNWSAVGVIAAVVIAGGSAGYTVVDQVFYQGRFVEKVAELERKVAAHDNAIKPVERIEDHVKTIEEWEKDRRNELDEMHKQANALELAKTEISGKLDRINDNLQHIKDAVDEVKNLQHKNPQSISGGNATSQ